MLPLAPHARILIVDDSCIARLIVQHVLRSAGFIGPQVTVVEAQNGWEGYRAVLEEPFDLIFSDMHMPAMSGIEMWEHVRHHMENPPPIIFVTSEENPQFIAHAKALGAIGVITKPFTHVSFCETLRLAMGRRHA